jgi:hypothetical protein
MSFPAMPSCETATCVLEIRATYWTLRVLHVSSICGRQQRKRQGSKFGSEVGSKLTAEWSYQAVLYTTSSFEKPVDANPAQYRALGYDCMCLTSLHAVPEQPSRSLLAANSR